MAIHLHGKNFIGANRSANSTTTLRGRDPRSGEELEPPFHEADPAEIDLAVKHAQEAFREMRRRSPEERATLLDGMADEIEAAGDAVVDRVMQETAFPRSRVQGEMGRTTNQLRMFAEVVREGSWVDARIDRPQPDRRPTPKPDIRRMLISLGPVAVFGASNFPLAFSVGGGDTASAIAAGSPVVVKAHPAHPGTSELVGEALARAVRAAGFHPGTFSMVHGANPQVSLALVRHPGIKAVGFTGSLKAGRAIFDAGSSRPEPIPVYAEMGSVNPVFILPRALRERREEIVDGLMASVTLGGGQFCTNPGVVVGLGNGDLKAFVRLLGERASATALCTMLHEGIRSGYEEGLNELEATGDVRFVARGSSSNGSTATPGTTAVLTASARAFLAKKRLQEEVFGPSTLVVSCSDSAEIERVAYSVDGNLTATLHGTQEDLEEFADLVHLLENKVGRLIFNGFPTGVEVCASMHHGGPYPATSDVRSTSVGTAAILRFARPICYQDFPQTAMPAELRDRNERGIWRTVDDELTKNDI
jgi:NADP-dependent aldehyde dehydrogenase